MKTETPYNENDLRLNYIIISRANKFYLVDNDSLKQDGIIAHALAGVFDDIETAKEYQELLLNDEIQLSELSQFR